MTLEELQHEVMHAMASEATDPQLVWLVLQHAYLIGQMDKLKELEGKGL